jgi:hypothetical protein
MVADVPEDTSAGDTTGELTRLRAEVALLRDELATAHRAAEKFETRLAKMRAARDHAEKAAKLISEALADRLRIDGTLKGRKHSLLARRQPAPTEEEAQQLELIRSSALFDAAWYLRENSDVVRDGDEPGLHFLRHPTRPIRAPGPDFDMVRYLDAHPEVVDEGVNPLVHFLLSEEGKRADRYPPQP